MKNDEIILGNNVDILKKFPDECIDLTVTSPPYDNLREYKGKVKGNNYNKYSFPFEELAKHLYRVTKRGGVVVWVVNDGTSNGSKTGNSLRQCLYFKECGFNIHDYMFYEKNGCNFPSTNRYYQIIEFMFILSKGKPKTVNLINDRLNKWAGCSNWGKKTSRSGSDELKEEKTHITPDYGVRFNIWRYNTGKGFSTKDNEAFKHPAIYPEELARDHILSWSNVGDVVLDPFIGSGTTAKMAMIHKRKYIGIDFNEDFVKLSKERVAKYKSIILNENYSDDIFINSLREKKKMDTIKNEKYIPEENTIKELFE